MSDDPRDETPAIPSGFPEDTRATDALVRRRRQTSKMPIVAMAVAVLLGGALAWGVVAMIPESWKGRAKQGDPQDTADNSRYEEPQDPDNDSPTIPDGPAASIPVRAEQKRKEKPAPADPDVEYAQRVERRAAELLADAKRLHSKRLNKAALRVLEDLRNRYPDTRAAIEAETLLLKIDQMR